MAALASRQAQLEPDDRAASPWLQATDPAARTPERLVRSDQGVRHRADPRDRAARPDDRRRAPVAPPVDRAGLRQVPRRAAQGPDPRRPEHVGIADRDQGPAHPGGPVRPVLHPQHPPGGQPGDPGSAVQLDRAEGLPGVLPELRRPRRRGPELRRQRALHAGVRGRRRHPLPDQLHSNFGPLFGNAVLQPLGTRPAYPGHAPPVVENVACYKNAVPNLNKVITGPAP